VPPFLLRYVASLAVLLAAYGVYALAAVPFIEPAVTFRESESAGLITQDIAAAAMERQREQLKALFSPGDWELASPKVLATEQGKLLFRDYKPRSDGRIELTPCTLVFFAGGSKSGDKTAGRPIVMRAPLAELEFDGPLHLGQADIGRLLGGRMKGEITITSRASRPGADDELEIKTRGVQLAEDRIWTPSEVRFRYGPSFGNGRDLTISFLPRAKNAGEKQSKMGLGSGDLKSLELVHVDKLHLVTSGGGILPNDKPDAASAAAAKPPLPVEVTCRGPFRFDFGRLIASFEEQVVVRRLHPGGASDALDCQLLELYFGKANLPTPSATPPSIGSSRSGMSGLEVQRLVAVGHPVVLKAAAAGGGASAQGQRFEYDLRTRRILLEDSQLATLVHGKNVIEARGVAYELGETGKLGRLWASGPGKFRTALGVDGKQPFEATWAKELRLRPHQGNHVISLAREASISFSNQGNMRADDIHVWLKEEAPDPHAPPSKHPSISPDKMLAVGNVQIDSPRLSGKAPRLEAWFKTEALDEASAVAAAARPFGEKRIGGQSTDPRFPEIEQEATAKPPQKFHITGNLIQIQMLRRGKETAAENVTVDGRVRLVELQPLGAKEPPLEMQGDSLQIFQTSSLAARARIVGQPAQVTARGMKMAGTNIQLHRGENRLWIDGAGEMVLPAQRSPLSALQRGGVDARREEQIRRPVSTGQTMAVTWQQRMNFDGQTVRFEKEVEARGETQFARGDVLDVTLNRRFDFSDPKPADRVDVERLAFSGGVFLESRTVEERRVTSIEQMQVRKLSLDNTNGRLHAVGPGWVSTVRLEGGSGLPGRTGFSPIGSRTASRPAGETYQAAKPAGDALSYLHVDFQTAIAGNLAKREIQFIDRVNAVYGPVASWEQELSKDRLEDLPEKGVLMNCDRLTVTEMGATQQGQKLYEMEAAGNARVEGKTFTATADRMTYAQAKDLIVLEGDGRADAELWRQSRVGGPTEHAAARKILFWKSDNRAQVDDARFLDLSQFGAPPPRDAPRK
jgi:lipopolysaccharide export system protein LptA